MAMSDTEEPQTDHVFGRTVINGTEFDAVLDMKTPDGRASYGLSHAESRAIAQLLFAGLDETEVPDGLEERVEMIARTFERTKPLEEVAEEVAAEERARGGI